MQLVPFGEYVPYASVFFFVNRIVRGGRDGGPGVTPTVFRLPTAQFGVRSATRTSSRRSPAGSCTAAATSS
jgi:hypothetical protein